MFVILRYTICLARIDCPALPEHTITRPTRC